VEAGVEHGKAWKLLKTFPGLKGGPAAWGTYATQKMKDLYDLTQSTYDVCVCRRVSEIVGLEAHG
jgi:hypothetical protein